MKEATMLDIIDSTSKNRTIIALNGVKAVFWYSNLVALFFENRLAVCDDHGSRQVDLAIKFFIRKCGLGGKGKTYRSGRSLRSLFKSLTTLQQNDKGNFVKEFFGSNYIFYSGFVAVAAEAMSKECVSKEEFEEKLADLK